MKKTLIYTAVLSLLAAGLPGVAGADELSDLKAEIASQKALAAAQKARLDALETKLNSVQAVQTQQAAAPAAANANTGVSFDKGEGLSYKTPATTVTLYGLIDMTLSNQNHANAAGDNLTNYRVAWFSGNRWGLTGKHDLSAGGLNVIFRLESEFETPTGSMDTPGVLFNRDAWGGLQSEELGKLTFGRQNALGRDISAIYGDAYGGAAVTTEEGGYTNNNNFKQLIFYAGSATGTRYDNGLVWKKLFKNGVFGGVGYQFGGVAGDFAKGSSTTGALGYNGGDYNLAGYYTQANVAGATHRSYSLGGNYTMGSVRVNAGYYHYTAASQGALGALGDRTDKAYTLSAKLAPQGSKLDYELGYQIMKASNAAVNGGGNVLNAFGNAASATATATGDRSTVYASMFYHFDKTTEVYVAADYLKLGGGYKVGATNGFDSQTEVGVGMRTRF
ncbi:porin [Roseateles koreensis]|uniref:Porin n=1 Tax=Roseateles koreensis TaxID=2987526 RepID=A0ABT5KQZ3_9BURK|nr:porin [Roseateles koreensis]MDC8785340.1 porin [Roseateles koreensis]